MIKNILNSNVQTIDKTLANSLNYPKMAKKANVQKPRCPKCNSAWTYYRIYKEEYYCRTCQYTWPYKPDDNKERELEVAPTSSDAKN